MKVTVQSAALRHIPAAVERRDIAHAPDIHVHPHVQVHFACEPTVIMGVSSPWSGWEAYAKLSCYLIMAPCLVE